MAIIPDKNPMALIAYYLGIFSLIPCAGAVLSIPAVILGVMGLRKAKTDPQAQGGGHAIAGIVLGGVVLVIYLVIFAAMVIIPLMSD